MADRRLAVEITVEGDATRVFKEIGQAAKASAQDMEASSRKAKTGLDQMDKAADSTEQSMRELEAAQKKAAAAADQVSAQTVKAGKSFDQYRTAIASAATGMGLLSGAFALYAQQSAAHEVTIMAVNRMYGEAADSYIAFADTIQNTSIFSNDEALAAARIMGTLRENYDLTDQQIQQLIQTSADLATMNGLTLTDAAQRVQAAIRGEGESAEALGLTMNQAAIDSDGLTLSMSNGEAAAFRYDALMAQTTKSVGAAAEAAETTTGKTKQLANSFQDAMMSVVDFTGPIGQAAAGLTSFGAEAGMAVTGLVAMAPAVAKTAAAIKGLSLATLGPAGLVIGLGAVTFAAWNYFDSLGDNGIAGRMEAAAIAGDTLADSIARVSGEMESASTGLNLFGDLKSLTETAFNDITRLEELASRWAIVAQTGARPTTPITIPSGTSFEEASAEWDELIALQQLYGTSATSTLSEVNAVYNDIINNTLPGHEAALRTAMNIMDEFQAGNITLDQLRDQLNGVVADLPNYAEAALEVRAAQEQLATATNNTRTSFSEQAATADVLTDALLAQETAAAQLLKTQTLAHDRAIDRQRGNLWSGSEPMAPDVVGITDPRTLRAFSMGQLEINAALIEGAAAAGTTMKSIREYVYAVDAGSKVLDQAVEHADLYAKSLEYGSRAAETSLEDIAKLAEEYRALADAIDAPLTAQEALGSTFNSVIGTAQGFAQLSASVWEWSNSLTEGNKATSILNDLNQKGLISDKTYRDGLEANHRIMLANNSVQEDSLRIQAKQLPLMADLAEEQARYVDSIADMPAEQALVTLGFLDQAKASQALQLAQLAAQASMSGMEESAGGMITAIAAADPVMKAMLIDMGLISEGADGTITVNFGDVEDGNVAIDNLTAAINSFAAIIAEAFGIDIVVNDGASGPLANILNTLNALDGKTSTVYINTVGGGLTLGAATGTFIVPDAQRNIVANVPGMSTGGHLRLVGEAGPELVTLPSGSTVTNAAGTRGRLDPMGRRRGNQGASVVYKGNVIHQTITVEESTFADRTRRVMGKRGIG